ncbi:MAG: aminotransferase class I/II-fold pyridoxal phosphate-dependent enzyme [Rhodothermales bacterium]|nr:aminotransferase class I/II-fold pyridoxal phosphate-dependent enzyme [Rhodothermales bacterium]
MNSPAAAVKPHVRGVASSATLEINEISNALRASGKTVYKLGLGQSPFPVPERVVRSLKAHAGEKDYLAVRGLPELRQAVADYHNRQSDLDYKRDDILIAPGSKELLYILQLVFDGVILLPSPSWVTYAPQAHLFGNRVVWIETRAESNWKLSPDDLEAACRAHDGPKLLLLNYPCNPTGYSYDADELHDLAAVMRRHRLTVLSDEIYGELHHHGEHVCLATAYPEGAIVSAGLSKWCGAGGWRLGTFAFAPGLRDLLDAMAVVASETFTATSAPIQYAAVTAYERSDEIDRYVMDSRRVLRALATPIVSRLAEAGAILNMPDGAFYLFPTLEQHRDSFGSAGVLTSTDLCTRLLEETGVATLPGYAFGRPAAELSLRIAYVDFDGATALSAASRLEDLDDSFVYAYCADVATAVERMAQWVESIRGR